MLVRDLIEELQKLDPEAMVVQTSGLGWPTFNPIDHTATVRVTHAAMRFPFWYEKVADLDERPSSKAVVIY
jgi:hypothetical protein